MTQEKTDRQTDRIRWVEFVCTNTNCVCDASPRKDKRNFERAHFPINATVPESIECTSCGSVMKKGRSFIK